ncbi:MAG: tripartite tricarboxylate transporter permease [Alphaproteobacteria bacterium]
MINVDAVLQSMDLLLGSWNIWIVIIPGLIIGIVAGSIAGVSNTMAMAICLPLTLYMDFLPAVLFLTAIFTGGGYGGAVTSILMGIPGTTSAVATTFDGYPMARAGKHNEALGLALVSSVFGVLVGYVVLFLLVAPMGYWVVRLGSLEMLMIALWGLTMIATLGSDHLQRGLIAGLFGVILGTVGMNTAGYVRGTYGISFLLDGIPVVPAMVGMFAASQLFILIGTKFLVEDESLRRANFRKVMAGAWLVLKYPYVLLRGTFIGVFIGAVPGVGASIGNLISYAAAKRVDRDSDSFGKGNPKGVIAAETANSSSEGGSMVTMLALGIPGGGGTAMLLAAFAMHNVTSGPHFISGQMHIVYAIIFSNFAQAFLLIFVGLAFLSIAGNIVRIPLHILIPSVMVLAVIGSFAVTGDQAGPITLFFFAILGWLMKRYDYPVAAAVIGLLLGRMLETELIRSYQRSAGEVQFILERPIALVFFILLVLSLFQPMLMRSWRAYRDARKRAGDA